MTERPAWHTDEYPELRAGPPWLMEEMIAAEPGLAAPILSLRAEGVGEAVRAATGAQQPVVVTGCGTSEHAALAVAAQLDEALRTTGAPGGWPEPRQAFEAALDPRRGGVLVGVSHEGGTVPTVAALQAAGGLGAVTAAITARADGAIAQAADHVLVTPLLDRSWCHTVGYVSPILAGAAIAAAVADRDVPVAAVRAHMEASAAVRPQAEAVAGALLGVERVLVVGGGVDSIPARELVLKLEEGLHLPAAFRDLETLLHGHFPATDERTGLVLVIADRRGHAERVQRAIGLLRAARRLGLRTAAILTPDASGALHDELTSAGRLELPHHRHELPASLEALLATGLALQHLTLGLVHAAGANPDLIRMEQDAYREAFALSRPEVG